MATRQSLIEAARARMHAQFPDRYLFKGQHEATITCDMLQFWLRHEPREGRLYEFTLSFLAEDVQRWAKLAADKGVEHFDIEFHPNALWREMRLRLTNDEYLRTHSREGIEQLVADFEEMLALAKQALALKDAVPGG